MKARAHIYVSGRVQGVFYRLTSKSEAEKRNVTGWIRNLPDGRVEAIIEGEKVSVSSLIDFCWKGSSGTKVEEIELSWEPYTGEYKGFRIV